MPKSTLICGSSNRWIGRCSLTALLFACVWAGMKLSTASNSRPDFQPVQNQSTPQNQAQNSPQQPAVNPPTPTHDSTATAEKPVPIPEELNRGSPTLTQKTGVESGAPSSKQQIAKALRRPTTPTDAKSLADRPAKPKFVGVKTQKNQGVYDLTFDDLVFEIKDGEPFKWSMITPEIMAYNGMKITLRGFIRPSFSQRNLKKFVFVRDNQECCFGPGAALFDCVMVTMAEGHATDFTVRPVTIEGDFSLQKYAGMDGNVWAIYRMKNAKIK